MEQDEGRDDNPREKRGPRRFESHYGSISQHPQQSRDAGRRTNGEGEPPRKSTGGDGPGGGYPGGGPPDGDDPDDDDDEYEDKADDEREVVRVNATSSRGPISGYYHPDNGRMKAATVKISARSNGAAGKIEDWIRNLLREKLAGNPEDLISIKGIKFDAPPTYNGGNEVESFTQWLQPFVRWLRLNRLIGKANDSLRVTVMGQYLKGPAMEWFNTIVDDSTRPQQWTFEKAVLGLFSRFFHQSTTIQATQKFENVKYVRGEGVAGLANELLKWADRMVEYPDDYTLRRAFYNALPTRISLILGPTRGMSPEKNLFNNLVDAAIEVEDALVGETLRHIPKGMGMVAGTSGMNN